MAEHIGKLYQTVAKNAIRTGFFRTAVFEWQGYQFPEKEVCEEMIAAAGKKMIYKGDDLIISDLNLEI